MANLNGMRRFIHSSAELVCSELNDTTILSMHAFTMIEHVLIKSAKWQQNNHLLYDSHYYVVELWNDRQVVGQLILALRYFFWLFRTVKSPFH